MIIETPLIDSQALLPGANLKEFRIEKVLGSGGFGITYLALDNSLGRQVVIKENLPTQFAWRDTATGTVRPRHSTSADAHDYEWSMQNFLREAETLASMDHPGIVRVLRKFETNGTGYFVMPYVEGVPFDILIEERKTDNNPFTQEELQGLNARMLDALGYIHDRGIYHRDIKPANLLITNEGIPVLIDFGSARQRLSERSMTVIESAGYTPFEQLQSRGNVGPWSDLYALGGTLEKAITGEAPPKAMDRMRQDPRIPLVDRSGIKEIYTPSFLGGIDKALEVNEGDRWQNAGEWKAGMAAEVEVETQKALPTPPSQISAPISTATKLRNQYKWWLALAALLVVIVAVSWSVKHNKRFDGILSEEHVKNLAGPELLALAEQGNATAQTHLGLRYDNGEGVEKDAVEAVKWYRKAAEQGFARAQYNLGISYDNGDGVAKDAVEALKWYRKAVEKGYARAQNNLGVSYYNGEGVEKDVVEAVKWFRKAADQGEAMAQTNLGVRYYHGEGVEKDAVEAVKWYRKAADQGHASAQNKLGACYYKGEGMEKDAVEAVNWYRKAADQGDAMAQTNLGACYAKGEGVEKDAVEAVKWFRKAADQGNAMAQNNIGYCYYHGEGVEKDAVEAVKWYRKAADQGHARAQTSLGISYVKGEGVEKDDVEAVKWFRKAADQGLARAQYNLGVCYYHGIGVEKDAVEAAKWFRKAAEQGDEMAQDFLNRLRK